MTSMETPYEQFNL